MKKILTLLALSWALTPPARADLIYTWTTTIAADAAFGPLTGSFTVPDTAISDGLITGVEITSYSFSDSLADFSAPSTSFSANIPVDSVTGAMLAPGGFSGNLGIEEGLGFNAQSLLLFTGPGAQLYLRLSITPSASGDGLGTWSNTSPAVIPEPASVTLLVFGLAGLAGYQWRRRRR